MKNEDIKERNKIKNEIIENGRIDGLVAQLEGVEAEYGRVMEDIFWTTLDPRYVEELNDPTSWSPTQFWNQGGLIIEREKIAIRFDEEEQEWQATIAGLDEWIYGWGETPLIAAMRVYVESKLNKGETE